MLFRHVSSIIGSSYKHKRTDKLNQSRYRYIAIFPTLKITMIAPHRTIRPTQHLNERYSEAMATRQQVPRHPRTYAEGNKSIPAHPLIIRVTGSFT